MDNFPKTLKEMWNKKKILTPEELEKRRQKERERHRRMRANYTPEQRAKRLVSISLLIFGRSSIIA